MKNEKEENVIKGGWLPTFLPKIKMPKCKPPKEECDHVFETVPMFEMPNGAVPFYECNDITSKCTKCGYMPDYDIRKMLEFSESLKQGQQKETYSIREFCNAYGIGQTTYYKMRNNGNAPKTIDLGGRVLITKDAAKEWAKKMEDEND